MKSIDIKLVSVFLVIFCFIACQRQATLKSEDIQLIEEIGFDAGIIKKIRIYTDSAFVISNGNSDVEILFRDSSNYIDFMNERMKGLVICESKEKAEKMVQKLKTILNNKGYQIYRSEMNFGYSPDKITILKTKDKYDLLRFEGTNGMNYNLYIEDIIDQLKVWDNLYGLDFIATGIDFIDADIRKLPKDMSGFCHDLYTFCPDIVEQGTGSIEALKSEISLTKKLFLWWD